MLAGKKIVLGVSGGIAAYKAVDIVRRLRKGGALVKVIMTKAAANFVTPLTFREISGNPVAVDMWSEVTHWNVEHIALATWADIFVIAPATANVLGKLAHGIADDMLSTTVMATTAPVVLAPAMNTNMYLNPLVQDNIKKLAAYGYQIIEPAAGELACGTSGQGRLEDVGIIVARVAAMLATAAAATAAMPAGLSLSGQKIIVTAAGTREPIDPVRYIGNRSSGKMGYALAAAAIKRGAEVTLVSGPSALPAPAGVTLVKVETAAAMRDAVLAAYETADIVIKAAAVADYRVAHVHEQKMKKTGGEVTLLLQKNPDILQELGQLKQRQLLVGFAAETEDLLRHARQKLEKKNLDMIIANDVTRPGAGFDTDTNIVRVLYRDGRVEELPQMEKTALAELILDKIEQQQKNS